MTKEDLERIFKELNIEANEGITNLDKNDVLPRIVYFDYVWKDITASGMIYDTLVTYQISFRSSKPRDEKLIELKNRLAINDLFPDIYIEYIENKKEWHSYFSIDVLENLYG